MCLVSMEASNLFAFPVMSEEVQRLLFGRGNLLMFLGVVSISGDTKLTQVTVQENPVTEPNEF